MSEHLLEVCTVTCKTEAGQTIFSGVDFSVNEGEIVVLQGKSGSGKTTLLKCLAHLNAYQGHILYRGRTPTSHGVPLYRTHVLYVPQRTSLLPGTPRDFLTHICSFRGRRARHPQHKDGTSAPDTQHPIDIAKAWGIEPELWDREWVALSGGEAQRVVLAVALGMDTAEILLLDEPTSALDLESSLTVEKTLVDELHSAETALKALVWITHSAEQAKRVGTRFLRLSNSGCHENGPDTEVPV